MSNSQNILSKNMLLLLNHKQNDMSNISSICLICPRSNVSNSRSFIRPREREIERQRGKICRKVMLWIGGRSSSNSN